MALDVGCTNVRICGLEAVWLGGVGRHLHHFELPVFSEELRGIHLRVGRIDAPHRRLGLAKVTVKRCLGQ